MVEYQYNWKKMANTWKCVPPASCPECGVEAFATFVAEKPKSVLPLTSDGYTKTEECFECGYVETKEVLTEEAFEGFASEEELPR